MSLTKTFFITLIALFLAGLSTLAHADASRLDDWQVVSRAENEKTRYSTQISSWYHKAGNETKSVEEYHEETGRQEPDFEPAFAAALRVVQANPTDDLAVLALQFLNYGPRTEAHQLAYQVPALEILNEHYTRDERIDRMLLGLARTSAAQTDNPNAAALGKAQFLDKVIADNEPGNEMRVTGALFFVMENLRSVNNLLLDADWRQQTLDKSISYARLGADEGEGIKTLGKSADEWGASMLNVLENQSIGGRLPDVTAKIVEGGEDKLSNHLGKVVLIDFWATWCVPCIATMPKVIELNEKLAGRPFEVITVSIDAEEVEVVDFMADRMELPFVNWFVGDDSDMYRDWNLTGVPYYFLLDANGVIHGRGDWDGLADEAVELLDAM